MTLNHKKEVVLIINAGSSSIKFSVLTCADLTVLYHGTIETTTDHPTLMMIDTSSRQVAKQALKKTGYAYALCQILDWLEQSSTHLRLSAVGHRVVHAGPYYSGPTFITAEVLEKLALLNPLAPLHQPLSLLAINLIRTQYPALPQIACFDTTFHHTQNKLATCFPIPRKLTSEGIIRYGFHGISYEYIASVLPQYLPNVAEGKIIVAHLGHGASMCAMHQRQSVATSMGLSALDGLMMGSRCGALDPGVILYLLQEKKYSLNKLTHLLYHESGLLGVSGLSSDMRTLEASTDPNAIEAIELFCYRAASELLSLCASLQGCDAIVFTAGIGENSSQVRKKISQRLQWLGVQIDEAANKRHTSIISQSTSSIAVAVIPTNEEYMIAQHTLKLKPS
ncbi:MAG: acetate kinase [Legionellales bacterium RIFCSPHIGHO2_12_FULL_42_9]|nr:MAG: acetate kinase [Legionellales bacterium RIFCSPHIGHO2_12_FULL_42_9]